MSKDKQTAEEFLDSYAIDDLNIWGRHEEHYLLNHLIKEYANQQTSEMQKEIDILKIMFKEEQFKLATLKQSADEMAQLLERINNLNNSAKEHINPMLFNSVNKALETYKKLI